jgi:biopolymer transport protein ExbD
MRFSRRIQLLCRPPDAAPLAGVFFLLLFFLLLMSPGEAVDLPAGEFDLQPIHMGRGPAVAMAVDSVGHLYFDNQLIKEADLVKKLQSLGPNLTVVLQADRTLRYEQITKIAGGIRAAGVRKVLMTTRPGLFDKQ